MIPCSWKETFGVECPACGTQRSFFALLQGDLIESLSLFPALLPFMALIVIAVIHLIRPFPSAPKWIIRLVILTGILMVGNWVLKMVV
ncbi:MAG: DUF2752 domain-containing protein [Bacteroidota bacterium]